MWRCNQFYFGILAAFGLGLLLGTVIEAKLACVLLGAGAIALGFGIYKRGR